MVTADWVAKIEPGLPPPSLFRARPVTDAQEILVCTYTADLRFFERSCLAEARQGMRARVTVVRDDALTSTATLPEHAGRSYTDVPVRCRNNKEFHPKLVVIAGSDRAVVAIGSGNMTSSGWHHNAELWTTLAATPDNWPRTFHDLAAWLRRLPDVVWMDPFGAARLRAVADLLDAHRSSMTDRDSYTTSTCRSSTNCRTARRSASSTNSLLSARSLTRRCLPCRL